MGATLYCAGDDEPVSDDHPLSAEGQQLAEIVVTENSALHRTTLKLVRFADRSGLVVIAIHRPRGPGPDPKGDLGDVLLRSGDVLLVQGGADRLAELRQEGSFLVLDGTTDLPTRRRRRWHSGSCF